MQQPDKRFGCPVETIDDVLAIFELAASQQRRRHRPVLGKPLPPVADDETLDLEPLAHRRHQIGARPRRDVVVLRDHPAHDHAGEIVEPREHRLLHRAADILPIDVDSVGAGLIEGRLEIGKPQRSETVVVSAASGAVGAVVGQLAKRAGAQVVGIAGGADKCRWVETELGFDTCIDHRAADLGAALDRACPKGIDVYWENVGGAVQQAVFSRLNDFARMVMCGMVAEYNDVEPRPGPNLMSAVRKRIKIQGFIVGDRWQRFAEYRAMAAPLLKSGELKYREDIVDGLDRAPEAFIGLLQGRNFGKLVVRLAEDPTRRT